MLVVGEESFLFVGLLLFLLHHADLTLGFPPDAGSLGFVLLQQAKAGRRLPVEDIEIDFGLMEPQRVLSRLGNSVSKEYCFNKIDFLTFNGIWQEFGTQSAKKIITRSGNKGEEKFNLYPWGLLFWVSLLLIFKFLNHSLFTVIEFGCIDVSSLICSSRFVLLNFIFVVPDSMYNCLTLYSIDF